MAAGFLRECVRVCACGIWGRSEGDSAPTPSGHFVPAFGSNLRKTGRAKHVTDYWKYCKTSVITYNRTSGSF